MVDKEELLTQDGTGSPCMIFGNENISDGLKGFFDRALRADEKAWWPVRDVLTGESAEGRSPVDVVKGMATAGTGNKSPYLNTYPDGEPSDIFPNLRVICLEEKTLEEALEYIVNDWCPKAENKYGLGNDKHVLLLTDKWDAAVFSRYEDMIRSYAMHKDFWFDSYLVSEDSYSKIQILPDAYYTFTRHHAP